MGFARLEEDSRAERRRAVRGPPFFPSSFSFSFSAASCAQAMNGRQMWKKKKNPIFIHIRLLLVGTIRHYSRVSPPLPAYANPIIRVSNNIARLGPPQEGPKPRQVLSLPPFPGQPLPGKDPSLSHHPSYVTAISWVKYYFHEIPVIAIRSHFHKGLVHVECSGSGDSRENQGQKRPLKKIMPSDVMEVGARIHVPVSIAETRISKRFDTIPSGTLYPNADEIEYLQRLVKYKDSAILVLNKPPRMPVKGNLPVHNSMDALAAAALSYEYDEGPKLVHRLDRESSGLHLMGRTKASINLLNWLFSDLNNARSQSKAWNDACEATCQRYWALVLGSPKEKEGLIEAPLSKVLLDDGKTERIILAQNLDLEACQEAITEYRVLGPTINGCTWMELRPMTRRKHQLRVHCAEALGTPIVGDYKYGWFVHRRWKQMARGDVEPMSGEPYKMRRPAGLDVQKGSVLAKVPLLHLHCRELVVANIEKFLNIFEQNTERSRPHPAVMEKPDLLRFVASMPSHMKISWNLMSSYLV